MSAGLKCPAASPVSHEPTLDEPGGVGFRLELVDLGRVVKQFVNPPAARAAARMILLFLPVLVLAACSPASAPTVDITLEATRLKFQPETLEVEAGQAIRLTFRNGDSVDHDFSVLEVPVVSSGPTQEPMAGHDMGDMEGHEPDLHVAAAAGQTAELEFTATQPGSYEFLCTVPGHKEAGMVGRLIVRAP